MKQSFFKRSKLRWISGVALVVLIGALIYAVLFYKNLTNTAKSIHESIDREVSDKREEAVDFVERQPFSILVLGVDETDSDAGRSDTLIVMTVNPKLKSTKMVSIPRDTYTDIVGKDFKDKINHAYAFGGIKMSLETVEKLFDIPLDYVVQVNMESFKDVVDAVGGIHVTNTFDFKVDNHTFPRGEIKLNGNEALAFVRMRYGDSRGDFGRQDRQKQVVQSVLKKGASVNSLLHYKAIFGAISNNVRTNMTFDEMIDIQANYKEAARHIEQLYINEGEGKRMNGIWYYIMNEEELIKVKHALKTHLEIL